MTTTDTDQCGKCGQTDEDGIFVILCRHVMDDDFDEDDEGERIPKIRVIVPLMHQPGPVSHLCPDPDCPTTDLCVGCANSR